MKKILATVAAMLVLATTVFVSNAQANERYGKQKVVYHIN